MTLAARAAARLPEGLLVRLISIAYWRFEPEVRHLDEICGRGGTMVDVGGWYGPWSRRLARRASRVITFEPTALQEVLRRTLPPTVDVIGAAASDGGIEAELWVPAANGAGSGLSSLQRQEVHGKSVTVPLRTVDSLALQGVTFIKIDVEGHEVHVLRGAEQTIKRDLPRLLIEVEEKRQPAANVTGLLASWGYQGWVMPARQWIPLDDFPLAAHQARNAQAATRGLLARVVWPFPRYVNSVLFLPEGLVPSASQASTPRTAGALAAGPTRRRGSTTTTGQADYALRS